MKPYLIAQEIRTTIEDDEFDCLEDKLEAIQSLTDFEEASDMSPCSLCDDGELLDECTGVACGKCCNCNGIGFLPIG